MSRPTHPAKTTHHHAPTRRQLLCAGLGTGLGTLLASTAAQAVPPASPPPQQRPLLLRNAQLHTVSGPVIRQGWLLAEKGRISALGGPDQPPPARADTQVIDLAGLRVYPGFVAGISALGLTEVESVRATVDHVETGALNPNARALVAINADSELLPVARANGVLAALVAPGVDRSGLIAGTSALVQLDGWHWDDMALEREVGVHVVLPSMRQANVPLHLRDEMARHVQNQLARLDRAFDDAAAWGRARAADASTPTDLRWQALQGALQRRQPVFVHANELPQIRHALGLARRHGLRLVLVGGADAAAVAPLLQQAQVPVIIGGVNELPLRRDDDIDARYVLAARLHQAGVRFCIARAATSRSASNERNLPYEAAAAVAYGLPRDEALKAITLYPAQILGVDDRLGSLQPGRLASFFVADGDPLETATQVRRLFVQGRELSTGNRHTDLQQRYEERLRQLGR